MLVIRVQKCFFVGHLASQSDVQTCDVLTSCAYYLQREAPWDALGCLAAFPFDAAGMKHLMRPEMRWHFLFVG